MKKLSRLHSLKYCFSVFLFLAFVVVAQGQSCFELRFPAATANTGDTVRLALTVRGFESIVSYQFAVVWNPADLQYIKHDLSGSPLDFQLFNAAYTGEGRLLTLWSDINALGVTLPDDAVLFEIKFKVLATGAGFYPVIINPDVAPAYEMAQEGMPGTHYLPLTHVGGGVRLGNPSDLVIASLCAAAPPCNAPIGAVNTSVSGGLPPYQYSWSGPNGFLSTESNPSNLTFGRYDLTVTDATGATALAVVELPFAYSSIIVNTISTQNAVCSQSNGCVDLSVSGGEAPYSFQWGIPGAATEDRCDVPPGYHKVTVTDAVGCIQIAYVQVGNDSLLSLELDSVNADCRFGQLGGINLSVNGTAPYSYTWSNGAITQNLSDIKPGWYTVTVSDAAGCDAVGKVKVLDYGTFDWGLWLSSYCPLDAFDTKPASITVRGYEMQERAELPLTLIWNSGTVQQVESIDDEVIYQTIAQITGMQAGPYSLTVTDAEGCSEQLDIQLDCYAPPPVVTNFGTRFFITGEPSSSAAVDSCVRIRGENINQLTEVGFSLKWENYMEFDEIVIPSSLNGLNMNNFTVLNNRIDFHWEKTSFYYLHNTSTLFKVCFKNNYWNSKPWVEFTSGDEMPTVVHPVRGELGFIGKADRVYFEYDPESVTFCDMNLDLADCAADGYARIRLHSAYCWNFYPNNYRGITVVHDGGLYAGPERMLFAQPGEYRVSQSNNSNSSRLYAYIPPFDLPASECVWPGDADNNGVVNQYDVLYLGLGMGSQGPARTDTNLLWQGADAATWPLQTPLRQVNFKNMDTDGNGVVEVADTSLILTHWGKAVNPYQSDPYTLPGAISEMDDNVVIRLKADTVATGEPVEIPVYLGASDVPVADLLGLTFSISFDTALLIAPVRFEPSVSWLGNPGANLICIQKEFPGQYRLDVALTRTNGTAAGGYGEIGKLLATFKALPPGFLLPATFFVTKALIMTPGEQFIALSNQRADFIIGKEESVGTSNPAGSENDIRLSPNPAHDVIRLESPGAEIRRVEISTASGRVVQIIETAGANQAIIPCEKLPASAYFARVYTEKGLVMKKFLVAR